ncbi:hypothetical protein [Luteococcus peritonei]|uniref:Uncharacterized protein n=1 Tax=Luteococcus peritonei TaxID=88874 RepID=A0ABW4RSI5_9ACTN
METTIDCGGCRNRGPACQDCVVAVLLEQSDLAGAPTAHQEPCLDEQERAAVAALAGQGLVPPLRLLPPLTVVQGEAQVGNALKSVATGPAGLGGCPVAV